MDLTQHDLTGEWKTSEGLKIEIVSASTDEPPHFWQGKDSSGKPIFVTSDGTVYHQIGVLMERRKSLEEEW